MNMKYCTLCGAQLRENARFCNMCGVQLYSMSAEPLMCNKTEPEKTVSPAEYNTPRLETLHFNSLRDANNALTDIKDISQISVNFETRNSYGLLANHSKISSVKIDMVRTGIENDKLYQIAEHEYTHLFFVDKSNISQKLQAKNPAVKIISAHSCTNSRGQAGLGMMIGVGVQSNRKVFVLYSTDRNQPNGIRF